MKLFAFIMAFIVLGLSCMPCMDEAYALHDGKAKTGISTSHSPADDDCTDDCSPFCSCSCCSGFAFSNTILQTAALFLPSAEKIAAYLPADISEIALPVWQPPKLS